MKSLIDSPMAVSMALSLSTDTMPLPSVPDWGVGVCEWVCEYERGGEDIERERERERERDALSSRRVK